MSWYVIVWTESFRETMSAQVPNLGEWVYVNGSGNRSGFIASLLKDLMKQDVHDFRRDPGAPNEIRSDYFKECMHVTILPEHQAPVLEVAHDDIDEPITWVREKDRRSTVLEIRSFATLGEAMKASRGMHNKWFPEIIEADDKLTDQVYKDLCDAWERFRKAVVKHGLREPPAINHGSSKVGT